jgi:preprotein translocase subunit SecD
MSNQDNNEQYLWDGQGEDSAVAEMEALLAPMRHQAPLRMRWRRPWLRALITALCGATLFFALFAEGRAPARFVGLFHDGPVSELTIHGGTRVELSVDGGKADQALNESVGRTLNARGARFDFASDASLVIELPEFDLESARAWTLRIAAQGNFTMHKVVEGSEVMQRASELARAEGADFGVSADTDYWVHDLTGREYTDYYLTSDSRPSLVNAFQQWKDSGELSLPYGLMIAYESSETRDGETRWRSYLLDSRPELSQSEFANSYMYWQPGLNRPEVLIEFTDAGSSRFAELTRATIGKKIAFVLDDDILAAPVVQAEITGGSTSVSMGGNDPAVAQAEAQALASVLRGPSLPAPVSIASIDEVQPEVSSASLIAARGFMALGVGLCIFLLAWPLERMSRKREPLVARLRAKCGLAARLRPALVTLLSMAAIVGLSKIWLPGTEEFLLDRCRPR